MIGLTIGLVIGWPIWSFERLTRAFVIGQGAVVIAIASTTVNELAGVTLAWGAACVSAFGAAVTSRRFGDRGAIGWTVVLALAGGAATLVYIREGM